jgi:anti-sigma factor RsiW
MDEHVVEERLLTYYFGAGSDEEGVRIDAHLCACASCLRAFLDLKRHVEHEGRRALRPRAETRARLRADVAAAFQPRAAAPLLRLRRALRQPIPLYQGLAVAAVAAALGVLVPFARLHLRPVPPPSGEHVDSARLSPESLTVY